MSYDGQLGTTLKPDENFITDLGGDTKISRKFVKTVNMTSYRSEEHHKFYIK